MTIRTDRPQHRRPKTPYAARHHDDQQRYYLKPEFAVRLALWLVHHTGDRATMLDRDSLIQMLLDWDMVKRDRDALQRRMNGTKIPDQFPINQTPEFLLILMIAFAADDLLAVAP